MGMGERKNNEDQKIVDKMLVILPFEEKLYRDNGVDCDYVGHPLVERINNYCFMRETGYI
jgi:lipid-A-disaccharide synthase